MIDLASTPAPTSLEADRPVGVLARVPRFAKVLGAYVAAFLVWLVAKPAESALWTNAFALPLGLAVAVLCFRVTRHPSIDRRVRASWRLIGLAAACSFAGDAAWLWIESVEGRDPTGSVADIGYLLYYPLLIAGLLRVPTFIRRRAEIAALVLDIATTAIGGGMVIGWFVFRPAVIAGVADVTSVVVVSYPVLDVVVLTALARLLLRRPAGGARRPYDLLGAALLLNLAGNVLWAVLAGFGGYATGGMADAFWAVFYGLVGGAAAVAASRPDLRLTESVAAPYRFSLTPYIGAAAGYGLVLLVALSAATEGLGLLVGAAVVLSAIVMIRQVLALRQTADVEREAGARTSDLRFRSLVQRSSDSILLLAPDGTILYASESSRVVLGRRPDAILGRRVDELASEEGRVPLARFLREALECPTSSRSVTWRVARDDGGTTLLESVATNLVADPNVQGLVVNSRDVTDRKSLEDQLMHQAFHDALTGLPNRALFADRVEHALSRAGRGGRTVSVVFVDLDNFKTVNDSLGHAAGDRVLLAAAERIRRCQRAEDTSARLGGDEFAVLLDDVVAPADPASVAERITIAFREVFAVEGQSVSVTASVGVAVASPGDTADVLLRNADAAMYVAKGRGRGRWAMFEPAMHQSAVDELGLRRDLHDALERDEFHVVYQPIVSLRDGRIRGAEALLRWDHPRRGTLAPGSFLALAEQTGAIIAIGAFVLERAAIDLDRWRRARRGHAAPYVSVNVSFRQLQEEGLEVLVRETLAGTDIPPASLILEITESGLVEDKDRVIAALARLRSLGVRVAIDDFGTGYSSLEYLQRLPMDLLKIPKTFVDGLCDDKATGTVPHAILSIARAMELEVVAEGVEDAGQARRLLEMGCTLAQGYHFARPMGIEALLALSAQETAREGAAVDKGLVARDA